MTNNLFDLTGKVAVVTGAGAHGGVGHALAVAFAQHGADVVVSDIDDEGARITGEEIEALGCKAVAMHYSCAPTRLLPSPACSYR